jgi:hypothetical protein
MKKLVVTCLLATLASCGDDVSRSGLTCGTGTVESNGMCVPTTVLTCGTGTHAAAGMCVPDDGIDVGAPTITSISPGAAGISGGTVFVITGTNFAGQGAGTATVKFGDQDAVVGAVSDTKIAGTIPAGVSITTTVTVTTAKGMAATPFHYLAIYAAEGRAQTGGELFIIDPTNGFWLPIDTLNDGESSFSVSAMAFGADGMIYAATAAGSNGETFNTSQLVKVDPSTAVLTVLGDLTDDGATTFHLSDLKFSGTTLYGWDAISGGLVTVDSTTGTVATIGAADNLGVGGALAFDSTGALLGSTGFANGTIDTVDTTTGNLTVGAMALNYPVHNPINAMALIGPTLVASVNNTTGGTMITVDPATGATHWLFEMPAFEGLQSGIDAIATAPDSLVIAHQAPIQWHQPQPKAIAHAACTAPSIRGRMLGHHERVALTALGTGALHIAGCGGTSVAIAAADRAHYALVGTRRGAVKLVDTATHETVLRDVQSI